MKQKLFDTDITISKGGRVQRYWMMKVMHPKFAAEEAKANNEVDMVAILKAYKVKAFEFGNWVSQNDRYDFVHAFVHSAELLSDIVGSKNLGLDLLLGVAFGARGRGGGAIAHYEPGHNVINLTRDKSYGCLAHEWAHAIDYNLGRHVDQNKDYSYLTGGRSIACILPENTGAQLRYWANAVVDEAKATESFARLKKADEYWHRRTEVWARYFEQYIAYQCMLKKKSPRFLAMTFSDYCGRTEYWKEDEFKKIARGSMFSFIAVLKGVLNNRYNLTACPYKYKTRDAIGAKPEPPKVKPLKVEKPKKAAATPKPKTVTTSTSKKKESSGVKAPKIKPLENFVLTKTGKLCTSEDVVSKWGSDNLKTWKRIYEVHTQEIKLGHKEAFVFLRYVICMKNGQYYISDLQGLGMVNDLQRNTIWWDRFIHPLGEKKNLVSGESSSRHGEYTFRDINEAFHFAEQYSTQKVSDNTKNMGNKYFHSLIECIYESEYEYAKYPNRRGKPYPAINWYEKPQPVKTITKK